MNIVEKLCIDTAPPQGGRSILVGDLQRTILCRGIPRGLVGVVLNRVTPRCVLNSRTPLPSV